jgi:hypothetical protein
MAKGNLIRDGLLAFLAFFTFLLLIGGTSFAQGDVGNFLAGESAQLKAQRIANAAMALSSIPSGHIKIEMTSYKVKIDGGNNEIAVKKADKERTVALSDELLDYESYRGPTSYTATEGAVCIRKSKSGGDEVLHLEPGC